MQPLEEYRRRRARDDRLADDVERTACRVNHGSSRDAYFGVDVAESVADKGSASRRRHRRLTRGSPVGGIQKVCMPEHGARVCVRVEGVDAVVLRGSENDVALRGVERQIRQPERLDIHSPINGTGEELAEHRGLDERGRQRKLLKVLPGARKVVVPGEDAREVGDAERRRGALRRVGLARRRNCERPSGWRSCVNGCSGRLIRESASSRTPGYAETLRIVGYRGR